MNDGFTLQTSQLLHLNMETNEEEVESTNK